MSAELAASIVFALLTFLTVLGFVLLAFAGREFKAVDE